MKVKTCFSLALLFSLICVWAACTGVGGSGPAFGSSTPVSSGTSFLYVSNGASNTISGFQVNNTTGTLLPLAGSPFASAGSTPGRMAADRAGRLLFVVNQLSSSVSSYAISSSTGLLFPGNTAFTAGAPRAVVVHPTASFVYVANAGTGSVSAFRFDANGALAKDSNRTSGGAPSSSCTISRTCAYGNGGTALSSLSSSSQ